MFNLSVVLLFHVKLLLFLLMSKAVAMPTVSRIVLSSSLLKPN